MKTLLRLGAVVWIAVAMAAVSAPPEVPPPPMPDGDIRLPSGKSQQEEILKADHEKDLKDAAQLIELSEQVKAEL